MRLRAERRVQKIVTATAIARNGMFAMASVLPRKAVSTTNAALTTRSQMTSGWARNRRDTSSANTPPPRALLSESGMAGMGRLADGPLFTVAVLPECGPHEQYSKDEYGSRRKMTDGGV